jgi:hypothetical protein
LAPDELEFPKRELASTIWVTFTRPRGLQCLITSIKAEEGHLSMVDFTELREGMPLGDLYILGQFIGHGGTGIFFEVFTGDGERLLIKLMPEQDPEAEHQFATWQRSRNLCHPQLLDMRDVGRCELAGSNYIYAVFQYPEDFLTSALEQGPLSEPETREVLQAVLAGLRYLHAQGLLHGAVTADQIVAVGDTVKLATDALRESSDVDGQAEDVRQLGELVRSMRPQELLEEPLATIALHATTNDSAQRWTLADIAKVLEPPAPVMTPVPATPLPVPPVRRGETEVGSAGIFPKWIFVAVAIILLSILMFNLRRKRDAAPVTRAVSAAVPATPAAPAATQNGPSVRVTAPAAPAIWRVIAFTYRSRDMAAKKVKQVNTRWPDLRAAVFAPRELRGYYLVTLGDRTNRENATRLQRKARSLGLPRDTYVQNYAE